MSSSSEPPGWLPSELRLLVTTTATPRGRLLGDVAPKFEANTTACRVRFHDFLGNSWGFLSSHPQDFTPPIALSIDSVEDHLAWSKDINAYNGEEPTEKLPFPIFDDKNRDLTILLAMLDPAEKDEKDMPAAARVVFVIGPDKKPKLSIIYPATTGGNFDDILR
nr:peroxiredoxin-6-like [Macaca fascicularis]